MQAASASFLRRSPNQASPPDHDAAWPSQASVQTPLRTPPRKPLTPCRPQGPVKTVPSPLLLPQRAEEAQEIGKAGDRAQAPKPLRGRRVQAQHDRAIEVLWVLVLAVANHQLRQFLAFPQDRGTRESWTGWALDVAVGLLLRALMHALGERTQSDAPIGTTPPESCLDRLESLLEDANARPRSSARLDREVHQILELQRRHPAAISLEEATWAVARLSQGALALPASTTASELAAFSEATKCLLAPAQEAHSRRLISDEAWQMAADHLERQVFERLARGPAALLGAALAEVRAQRGQPC